VKKEEDFCWENKYSLVGEILRDSLTKGNLPIQKNWKFVNAVVTMNDYAVIVTDIGVMSGAAIYIKRDLKITDVQIEILMGIINLYSLIGSCLAGRTSDWIGRRYTIVFAGTIFFAGAILMGFSPNYAFLMFGRFVAGIGIGYALMIAPVYTAEVSPASTRGFLTSFPEVGHLYLLNQNLFFFFNFLYLFTETWFCRFLSMEGYCSDTYPTLHFQSCHWSWDGEWCLESVWFPRYSWHWECWRCRNLHGGWWWGGVWERQRKCWTKPPTARKKLNWGWPRSNKPQGSQRVATTTSLRWRKKAPARACGKSCSSIQRRRFVTS